MASEKTGYIYVLTNESFHRDNWIKIGYAEDVEKRVKELSNTSIPLPYEVYCTYEIPRIEGVKDPDKLLHDLITKLNPTLRISPNREFFEMLPWDAYEMLASIAQMHGRMDKLKRNDENKSGEDIIEDSEYSIDALFPERTKVRDLFEKLKTIILSVDNDLDVTPTNRYVAVKINKKKNLLALWPKSSWIEIVLNAKLGQISDDKGLIYDISNRKWTSAQYALRFYEDTDENEIKNIIEKVANLKTKKE